MSDFENILVIDSAMAGCGAAVRGAAVRGAADAQMASHVETMTRGQAEALIPLIEDVMAQANMLFNALDAIVVTTGPGAFTGLRIGMSTAKAYGIALDIPVFGITTLQSLALCHAAENKAGTYFSVIVETKRSDFYVQNFDTQAVALNTAKACGYADVLEILQPTYIGDAVDRFATEAGHNEGCLTGFYLPDPAVIAECFVQTQGSPQFFTTDVSPVYLRAPDVSLPKNPPRVIAQA